MLPVLTFAGPQNYSTYSDSPLSDPQSQAGLNPHQPYLQDYLFIYATTTADLPFAQAATALTLPYSCVNLGPSDQQRRQQAPGVMYPNAMMGSVFDLASPYSSAPQRQQQNAARVAGSRPKPQCWEHGCNDREFSTFGNLLRHQREKSGQTTKSVCPNCGAEFTRTTARNDHQRKDRCKTEQTERSA
ncbi:hypothetical protein PpBr36_06822 [Pyricularia pennisetigena]|uniref:hypothetical protein n=1 Tax=Pyricularia pennisetigena TaxID=1578925 RepID=UPI00114D9249|nr:hypothetical protein PpBr36_06822 [Pyricularia pennisetigena]TLS25147.1 hypothetical protein PpBr36_06822 [Pyricularia pennisetigena]